MERYLIEHCSQTLASLKTASLFTFEYSCSVDLERNLNMWNTYFKGKGITLIILRKCNNRALIYVCRKSYLERDLNKQGVKEFLSQYGYTSIDVDDAINVLKYRLEACDGFPHEIGIFLGYPLGDVIGFIENAGQNSKCTGCWKVYCNECEAVKIFARYKKCKDVYMRLWKQGRTVEQLTVVA
jgi:hypothetical protein